MKNAKMKLAGTKKPRPVLGDVENDRASLSLELQDMLNHGSDPELFERVMDGLSNHSLIRIADENQSATTKQVVKFLGAWATDPKSTEHLQSVCDRLERLKQAVKPRTGRSTVERPTAERLPLRCSCCREVLEGLDIKPAGGMFYIAQCPKCGVILGMAPARAASRIVEEPTIAPTRETIQ